MAGIPAILLTHATLALLLYDLDRPDRFFYLLVRPQWRSWVARAAWILTGFAIGLLRSPVLGWQLVLTWVVINGGLSAQGALLARGHPLTVLSAMVAAPLTSLNPTIAAGMVTGIVESWLRQEALEGYLSPNLLKRLFPTSRGRSPLERGILEGTGTDLGGHLRVAERPGNRGRNTSR